jgi:hypothetical protein
MKNRIHLELYSDERRDELIGLLTDMSNELFGSGMCDVDKFVDNHFATYLAVYDGKAIGLSSFHINDYFGMKESVLGNTYIYVDPKFRNTRAFYLFALQSGVMSIEMKMDLEHYYSNDTSSTLGENWLNGGKMMYKTFVYNVKEVSSVTSALKAKLKIKDRE